MTWSGIWAVDEGKGMAVDRKVEKRLVLVTDMLAAASDELRRVIAELTEMTEGGPDDDARENTAADRDTEI